MAEPGASIPPWMWPQVPPVGYLGQLEPEFQAWLADQRAGVGREDCDFYHTVVLSNGEVVPGAWDLRGAEDEYLGGTHFGGQRVLELGPATGALTRHMEEQGAEVVCFEAGFDVSVDVLPFDGADMRRERLIMMRRISLVQNSWWYVHRDRGSSAKMVYANIYAMPGDLGKFDTTVVGSILLHLQNPWIALSEAARRTTGRMVVTDLVQDPDVPVEENLMRFSPLGHEEITNWWSIHPGAVVSMLRRLGFGRTEVTLHTKKHHIGHRMDQEPVDMSLFTVVGERG